MLEIFSCPVLSSPIFNHGDDPVRHWKGGYSAGVFDYARVDFENLVCALAISSGTKEYALECARAHGVGDCWVFVGFNV